MTKAKDTDTINVRGHEITVAAAIELIELSIGIVESASNAESEWYTALDASGIPHDPNF